jgi:queuine tRNA-ribosyltransferase
MGVGTPEDLVAGVAHGVDMFDCVMPTRNARNGWLFTRFGDVKIRNAAHRNDAPAGRTVRLLHLPQLLAGLPAPPAPRGRNPRRAPEHDPQPHYYLELMREMREAIEEHRFEAFRRQFAENRARGTLMSRPGRANFRRGHGRIAARRPLPVAFRILRKVRGTHPEQTRNSP